jgi:hypothetical protein
MVPEFVRFVTMKVQNIQEQGNQNILHIQQIGFLSYYIVQGGPYYVYNYSSKLVNPDQYTKPET